MPYQFRASGRSMAGYDNCIGRIFVEQRLHRSRPFFQRCVFGIAERFGFEVFYHTPREKDVLGRKPDYYIVAGVRSAGIEKLHLNTPCIQCKRIGECLLRGFYSSCITFGYCFVGRV